MSFTASFDTTLDRKNEVTLAAIARQALAMLATRRESIRARARVRHELSQYSDRELHEIGLSRGDIEDVVHGRYGI